VIVFLHILTQNEIIQTMHDIKLQEQTISN